MGKVGTLDKFHSRASRRGPIWSGGKGTTSSKAVRGRTSEAPDPQPQTQWQQGIFRTIKQKKVMIRCRLRSMYQLNL